MEANETSELGQKPSLEERIAQKYQSPEQDAEVPEAEEPELPEAAEAEEGSDSESEAPPAFEEVEFEGKVYQVPTEIKNGLMHHADYTRKAQEIAKQREGLELHQQQVKEFIERQQFEQSLSQELSQINLLDHHIEQYRQLKWADLPDAELTRRHLELQQLKERREEMNRQVQGKRQQFSEQQKQRLQEVLVKAQETLTKHVPGWNEQTAAEVSEYALSQGYTQHEVNNVVNPRDVETLWKAMQFDKLSKSKEQALKKAQKAPPVVKPGSVKPMPKDVRDKLNFRKAMAKANKTGMPEAQKARLIHERLTKKFGG